MPLTSLAAGLGKITVLSALGQPLRAEIDVSATREELADMKARLASPETFKQAGLDYATTLLSIKFNLEKRPNGQPYIKLTSDRPINDPFVDMLLELNWSSGRLVREYTFLLDPPEFTARTAPSSEPAKVVSAPLDRSAAADGARTPAAAGSQQLSSPSGSRIDSDVRDRALARVNASESGQQKPAGSQVSQAAGGESTQTHEVRNGDTLHRVANEVKPAGVSLDQMLVALFRANPDAFEGGNMNRLKTNKILSVPDKSTVESVSQGEARRVVLAQSSDWNAYRNRLAGVAERSPARGAEGRQSDAGKITAKVDDSQAQAALPKDQLKVAKTDLATQKGRRAGAGKASDEDLIAKDKALQEANERVAALNKIVADMQKLIEIKDRNLADLQKQASAAKAEPATKPAEAAAKPSETGGKPAEAVKPADSKPVEPVPPTVSTTPPDAKVEPSTSGTDKPVAGTSASDTKPEGAKPEAVKPDVKPEDAKPVESKPDQPKPAEPPKKPRVVSPPPPPPPEPSFFDELLDNYYLLGGLASLLAGILALFLVRKHKANKEFEGAVATSTLAPQSKTSLMANSVFRSTGGQSVDTSSDVPAPQTDFSQAGPGSIDTDEVDPVAEADVYMAYGRDVQAEEILIEARQKDPKRPAIMLKLLEIYAGRNDTKAFETLATELYSETSGAGADWEKAAAMGARLDPDNMLFQVQSNRSVSPEHSDSMSLELPSEPMDSPSMKPSDDIFRAMEKSAAKTEKSPSAPPVPPPMPASPPEAKPAELAGLDFDLGLSDAKPAAASKPAAVPPVQQAAGDEAEGLDFDLEIPETKAPVAQPPREMPKPDAAPKVKAPDLEFETVPKSAPAPQPVKQEAPKPSFNMESDKAAAKPASKPQDPRAGAFAHSQSPDVEFDVSLTESTFLDRFEPEMQSFDLASIDLDLQSPELEMPISKEQRTLIADTVPAPDEKPKDHAAEKAQATTVVNPNAAIRQIETMLVPEHSQQTQLETLLVPSEHSQTQLETMLVPGAQRGQSETVLNPDFTRQQKETVVNTMLESATEFDTNMLEEAVTKLELAKAYEEMGDLEGARELLQEVIKEGNAEQRDVAQGLLAKIGK